MIAALFVLYVVVEVGVLIWVGSTIGVLWTVLLLGGALVIVRVLRRRSREPLPPDRMTGTMRFLLCGKRGTTGRWVCALDYQQMPS